MRSHESNGQSLEEKVKSLRKYTPYTAVNGRFTNINNLWHRNTTTTLEQGVPKHPMLIEWMKKNGVQADVIRDEAADLGSETDEGTNLIDAGETLKRTDYRPLVWASLVSYSNFYEDVAPEVLAVQRTVHAAPKGMTPVCGTFDKLVRIGGELGILDVKRVKNLYPSHTLQVQTYAAVANLMGIPVRHTHLLRLSSQHKRKYELRSEEFDPAYFDEIFRAASLLADYMNEFKTEPIMPPKMPDTLAVPVKKPDLYLEPLETPNGNGHPKVRA